MDEENTQAPEQELQPSVPQNDNRITQEQIEAWMERVGLLAAHIEGTTTTVCHAFLDGTFYLGTEYSACVDPANFDEEFGKQLAAQKCISMVRSKAWELLGYELYSRSQAGQIAL